MTIFKCKRFKRGFIVETWAKSYSTNLHKIFDQDVVLKVHSTYKNTVNFLFQNRLFSIHHREVPLTPMAIILDLNQTEFNNLLSNPEMIEIRNRDLIIDNLKIRFHNSNQVSLDLLKNHNSKKIDAEALKNFYLSLFDYLASLSRHSDFFSVTFSGSNLENYYLAKISSLIKEKDPLIIGKRLTDLIGLGRGLTPAGDDVVCGILATFGFLDQQLDTSKVSKIIEQLKSAIDEPNITNDVSREFLNYALEGYHSLLVSNLYDAVATKQNIEPVLENISNQGFSSGIDFLTGMYIGHLIGGNLK